MDDPRAGAFRLMHRLDAGGMGEVWRGEHVSSGLPVAIKLIRPDLLTERSQWEFEREVRYQARLGHPGIVYLYDHGRLSPEASAVVGSMPGGPWLAMEYCSGDLQSIAAGLGWTGVRSVLLQLLDALAHAHANGVLHRDIKIANVLVSTTADVRPGVKLADFGIAHVLGDSDETTRSVGTPRYMAPEQVVGEWEDHGPWTDLYALGVLAWRLVTGKRPFGMLSGSRLAMAMLREPLGWPGARFSAPPGVSDWIARMTAKAPADRFQLAADAAQALEQLPDRDTGGLWLPPTGLLGTLIPFDDDTEVVPTPRAAIVQPMDDPPPESEANIQMHAAGLGLLALRRPALIGRRDERIFAWRLLRRVARSGRPAVLAVTGPPRVGRTRFLEWLAETTERSGQAVALVVRCVPGRDLGDQLVAALRLWFRVGSRDLAETTAHLETWLGEGPWLQDTAAMLVRGETADRSWQPILAGALAALGRRRPLVLRIEGTERETDLQGLVDQLRSIDHAPVLVTIDRAMEGVSAIALGPLSDASMHRLADSLVSLDSDVRSALVARTRGSPGFLVQTLNHWASRGLLLPGPKGFRVADVEGGMPPTLAVVSTIRLNAVLQRLPEGAARSLQRAALLGDTVDPDLWDRVDGPDRAGLRNAVRAVLLDEGLAVDAPPGWRFLSVPFREAVLARAVDLAEDHRRCAEVLAARGQGADELALGRHRLASGDVEGALVPLARGCERVAERAGGSSGLAALPDLRRAVAALSGPQRLRWAAVVDQLEASFLAGTHQLEGAEECARRALRTAELLSDRGLAARCWAALGSVASGRFDSTGRADAFAKALELADDAVRPEIRASWWVELGKAHLALGDRAEWSRCMAAAGRCAEGAPDHGHIAPLGRAVEAQTAGRFDEALRCLDEAMETALAEGSGRGRLAVLRSRAHTLLEAERLEEAREVFREALALALALRSVRAAVVLANAVSLDLRLGRFDAAVDLFERHRYLLPAGRDRQADLVPLHCAGLAIAAQRRSWDHAAYHLERVREHGSWSWAALSCNVPCCAAAADRARSSGQPDLADAIVTLARERATPGNAEPEEPAP
ncbi:MAG: serine/threonine-protein kinase [Myxococcota bacterium]